MRDVVVALPRDVGLQELAQSLADSPFEVIGPSDGRLAVQSDGDFVQFLHDQSLSEHYEDSRELDLLAKLGSAPNLFLVNFKSARLLGRVFAYTVDRSGALVDNDFGEIEVGSEFVKKFRNDPDCRR